MVREFHEKFDLEIREPGNTIEFDPRRTSQDEADLIDLRGRLITEEHKELWEAHGEGNLVGYVDAVCDLVYVLVGSLVSYGVDFDKCFAEVHRSNMSKLDENGNVIKREDGKILKSDNYSPADLRPIVYGEVQHAS